MPTTTELPPELTLQIQQEIDIQAPIETVFEAMLEQLGPQNDTPNGDPLTLTIEPWPGGRWYRDMGDNNGHLWGHVQVIKRPSLLEFTGPLFMSYAAVSHVKFKLTAVDGATRINFSHTAIGMIQADHRRGVTGGWDHMLKQIRKRAQGD